MYVILYRIVSFIGDDLVEVVGNSYLIILIVSGKDFVYDCGVCSGY